MLFYEDILTYIRILKIYKQSDTYKDIHRYAYAKVMLYFSSDGEIQFCK